MRTPCTAESLLARALSHFARYPRVVARRGLHVQSQASWYVSVQSSARRPSFNSMLWAGVYAAELQYQLGLNTC